MERIPVTTPEGNYHISIKDGLLADIAKHPDEFGLGKHVVIATDTTVKPLYAETLASALPHAHVIAMQEGEQHKNLDTVRQLYDQLFEAKADRHTTIVALGGGVVGDTVGFVAATFMRGVRLVQIPTTLLAMVDSSVGGKVGVDVPQGKNLVGAFKQPSLVLIDPTVLQTLPHNQWRAGMAEVIKHGLLADEKLLESHLWQAENAHELIYRAVQVKVNVVEEDPYEHSIRAFLNLGHTFAHAIEQVTHYAWLHGDAVGIGLLLATRLSVRLGLCDEALLKRVDGILQTIGLPRTLGALDPQAIYDAMATDKKWQSGKSRFVLLEGLGKPRLVEGVAKETVIEILEGVCTTKS
jgi:3-dehydroquinate synthase